MKNNSDHLNTCPICSSKELKTVYRFDKFFVLKCKDCDNSWRSNMYDEKKIEEIYCIDDYESNPYFSYGLDQVDALQNNRFRNYQRVLDILKEKGAIGKLLDIGCGSGTFLSMAKKYGWDLTGIEISEKLSEVCQKNVPDAKIINARFEDTNFEGEKFDLIALWDVIEHVIDPIDVIQRIKDLLVDGGVAVFCTPDEASLLAQLGKFLYHINMVYPALALHPPNHTYFFSKKGFGYMMKKRGMRVLKDYSQQAFFEHSEMASKTQKIGISLIESFGGVTDSQYEMVVFAQK